MTEKIGPSTPEAPEGIKRRATELAVQHEDCPWCVARAGELCFAQGSDGQLVQHLTSTHIGRFAGLGDPAEYVARFDGPQ